MSERQGPEAFMDEARRMAADRDRYRPPPDVVALGDQVNAHNFKARVGLAMLGHTRRDIRDEVRNTALMLAIITAAQRRWHGYCPHLDPTLSPPEQDCNLSLGPGLGFCQRSACHDAALAAAIAALDDDACDLCDARPTVYFREVTLQVYAARIFMNVCRECWAWISRPESFGDTMRQWRSGEDDR
jgi:hypothetical protein